MSAFEDHVTRPDCQERGHLKPGVQAEPVTLVAVTATITWWRASDSEPVEPGITTARVVSSTLTCCPRTIVSAYAGSSSTTTEPPAFVEPVPRYVPAAGGDASTRH